VAMWWLRDVPDDARVPTEVRAAWEETRGRLGFLPNVQRLYALRPRRFLRWLSHYSEVLRGESALSPVEREMIAVLVSNLNGCTYCLTSHGGYLRAMTGDPEIDARLQVDWQSEASTPRLRAILGLAVTLTLDPFGSTPVALDALRAVGLTEPEIFDTVETIAMFNFTNRLTSGLGMVPNAEFSTMGRSAR